MNNDQPRPFGEQPVEEPTQPVYQSNLQQVPVKPFASDPAVAFPPKKSGKKKGLIIGGIIAAVLAILGGGSAFAYQFWYQNPEKVVTDSIMNAFKAKTATFTGSMNAKTDMGTVTLDVDGASGNTGGELNVKATVDYEGKPVTLIGDGLIDSKGTLYFKVKNIKELMATFRATLPAESQGMFDQFVTKIDDRWIKISSDDTKEFSEEYSKSQKCFADVLEKFKNDKTTSDEIVNAYKKNRVFSITQDLGKKDGSLGYSIKVNDDARKGFIKALKDTKMYASMKECDASFNLDENDVKPSDKEDKETKVELWVSEWSHRMTKIVIKDETGPETGNITIDPIFNQPVDIKVPEKAVTLRELADEIEALAQSFYAGAFSEQPESMDL